MDICQNGGLPVALPDFTRIGGLDASQYGISGDGGFVQMSVNRDVTQDHHPKDVLNHLIPDGVFDQWMVSRIFCVHRAAQVKDESNGTVLLLGESDPDVGFMRSIDPDLLKEPRSSRMGFGAVLAKRHIHRCCSCCATCIAVVKAQGHRRR